MKEDKQESNESTREKYVAPTYTRFVFEKDELLLTSGGNVGFYGDDGEDRGVF